MTREKQSSGFPIRSDKKRPVQSQKKVRILKFWVEVAEELYYPSSENKGTDQLCSYCSADLRLCFYTPGIYADGYSFRFSVCPFVCSLVRLFVRSFIR